MDFNRKTGGCTFCGSPGRIWIWGKDEGESVLMCDHCKIEMDRRASQQQREQEQEPAGSPA
jgi:hypothetical protein